MTCYPRLSGRPAGNTASRGYDATEDASRLYGADFPHYFRWPQDTFSHLTHQGFLRYGGAIADRARDRLAWLLQ